MKKRATLLIINLEKIYTMDMVNKHPLVFQHAFIAIHHESAAAAGGNMRIRIPGFWMAEVILQYLAL